jgi:transposase
MTNGTASTAPSTAHTNTRRAPKGGCRARHRPFTRRPVDKGSPGRRRAWTALAFEITEGQRHDSKPAAELVARVESECLLADKAYDCNKFRDALAAQACTPVIPSNRSRAQKLPYDKELYKARSEIECTFSLLKQARRFATRYEKTLRNYAAVVALGCALLWLRI